MSDALSCTEINGQHIELLPARTVMSMIRVGAGGKGGAGGTGGIGGAGGKGLGSIGINICIDWMGGQTSSAAGGMGGTGGMSGAGGGKA